jgi:hypothetical protein
LFSLFSFRSISASGAFSDDPNYRKPFALPEPPAGCVIVLYGPLPAGIMGEASEKLNDWKQLLTDAGVHFPDKRFALFDRPAKVLAVATDAKNQELVQTLLE